jgi:hypothetical protein
VTRVDHSARHLAAIAGVAVGLWMPFGCGARSSLDFAVGDNVAHGMDATVGAPGRDAAEGGPDVRSRGTGSGSGRVMPPGSGTGTGTGTGTGSGTGSGSGTGTGSGVGPPVDSGTGSDAANDGCAPDASTPCACPAQVPPNLASCTQNGLACSYPDEILCN